MKGNRIRIQIQPYLFLKAVLCPLYRAASVALNLLCSSLNLQFLLQLFPYNEVDIYYVSQA